MVKLFGSKGKGKRLLNNATRRKRPLKKKYIIYASMIIVGVIFVTAALWIILGDVVEDAAARSEYELLRDNFPQVSGPQPTPVYEHSPEESEDTPMVAYEEDEEDEDEETGRELRELTMDELAEINDDLIGWINANNNMIDYPVVKGSDNEKYINTTFFGTRNSAGAIFMDYRHSRGFNESVVILYGHRTRDYAMFSSLVRYLDPEYKNRNPRINILTRDGRRLTYMVFAAKLTDAWDPAYSVSDATRASEVFPDAPANAARYLLLSTCTSGDDDDERIIVFAALY